MITKVKGTQDIIDLTLYNYTLSQIRDHLNRYHFDEIITPILEPTELFQRSLGLNTDVVTKEMFIIKTAKDDNSICLRPEATASTVRAFIENGIATLPWKVFSCGPMFRHERPQKGRYREFRQVTIELIGAAAIAYDVQLIVMLERLFHEQFKLNNFALQINFLGCRDDRGQYARTLKAFLESDALAGICAHCVERKEKNILRMLDCKNETCQQLYSAAPQLLDHLCTACASEWQQVQEQLSMLSVSYVVNPRLVRGLDYYNKTVFEFTSANLGAQNAFCAGGRYDELVKEIGGKQDQPSVGAAIGVERLMLLLEQIQDQLPILPKPALQVIIPLEPAQQVVALILADELQDQGFTIDVLFDGSLKSSMRRANKIGAQNVLLIGEQEQQDKTVTIKNMMTGGSVTVGQREVVEALKK